MDDIRTFLADDARGAQDESGVAFTVERDGVNRSVLFDFPLDAAAGRAEKRRPVASCVKPSYQMSGLIRPAIKMTPGFDVKSVQTRALLSTWDARSF